MAVASAFVVVNYGSSSLLEKNLIQSVFSCGPDSVVVVDNFTTDEERTRMRALAARESWALVEPVENLGFGGGMNLGVARALELGAREFLLLNPDARIEAQAWLVMLAALSPDALVAPRVVDGAGQTWFDGADVYLADGLTMSAARRARRPDEPRWEWLTGACLLLTDALWARVGGFDEDYFLYWEDVDLSRRVVAAGGRLIVAHEAVVVHDEGGTHGEAVRAEAKSSTYYYYAIRNRLMFAVKHLDEEGVRRWARSTIASAKEVLLRGGRRQFLRPMSPLVAAYRGVRDGRRLVRAHFRAERGVRR
ncbi:glycosyltransferase family 2 protein [uncultured Microbacterium sp.]|uniref:Putative dual-domain glycosyl transferase n=1 Tax=uncultured Microbacterium sp. TaxID=191216 RepID=A0A1Y5NXL5_9MICO